MAIQAVQSFKTSNLKVNSTSLNNQRTVNFKGLIHPDFLPDLEKSTSKATERAIDIVEQITPEQLEKLMVDREKKSFLERAIEWIADEIII